MQEEIYLFSISNLYNLESKHEPWQFSKDHLKSSASMANKANPSLQELVLPIQVYFLKYKFSLRVDSFQKLFKISLKGEKF